MQTISILLADDHTIIRQGLRALLSGEQDLKLIAEATTGREAVALSRKLSPDVVVMDLAMPMLNGMEATRQILNDRPSAKIVILSAYDDDEHVNAVLKGGAAGYLLKQTAASELIAAVREVYKGNAYYSPAIAERLRKTHSERLLEGRVDPTPQLSIREAEVFQLIAEGFINKQIADQLNLSVKTVEKHRQSLMNKLKIHCIADLVRHAAETGIIEMRQEKL